MEEMKMKQLDSRTPTLRRARIQNPVALVVQIIPPSDRGDNVRKKRKVNGLIR
jgi:hypothetical protein